MIAIEPHAEGAVVPIKALPGSRQNGVRGEHAGELKVSVTQVAEKGKATRLSRPCWPINCCSRNTRSNCCRAAHPPTSGFWCEA